jgi:hypothetical protein
VAPWRGWQITTTGRFFFSGEFAVESTRKDGRGHWPPGKRRNQDGGNWGRIRLALSRFLDEHYERGRISVRALAAELAVSDRSVRRWLTGDQRPSVEYQFAVAQWLKERRAGKR